ncbi:MAG TPA: calcineurin-like phosphoesterase family protein [Chryseosolibacter sp.]|nr:calcineurin-like phosphoesterase family protein [Chryseosolibacter sp.]
MKTLLTCLLVVVAFPGLHAQSSVKGYVYEDTNGNGKKERREKGIAGVSVSNGIDVTITDSKGLYQLSVGEDNIIFISKPSGYKVPLNEKNQPQFYYVHKPKGHPSNYKYKGVPPTGKLPKSVDFPLTAQEDKSDFTALIFGDPQPYTQEEVEHFSRGIVDEVAGIQQVSFGLSLGDLVGDNLDLHSPYIDAVQQVGIPWYNLMGNHDMNYEARYDSLSDETYEANFGPANYSFNYGKAHFIILDDILYPDPRDEKGYWGGFRKGQLDFIENDLKHVDKDKLIVQAFHIPLQSNGGNTFREQDRQRLFNLLKDFPNTLSLSAHTHLQRNNFYTGEDGWRQEKPHHEYNAGTTSGDWYSGELDENGVPFSTMRDGTPKGYAFIHFTGNQYVIDYKAAGKPKEHQMEIYSPKVIPFGKRTSAGIYVNFFMGAKGDRVEYRIGGGDWKKMNYVEDVDPSYMALLYRWDTTDNLMPGRRPSNAVESTHLWRAGFPSDLKLGDHTIEIRATDMFGRQFTQTKTVRVQQPAETE